MFVQIILINPGIIVFKFFFLSSIIRRINVNHIHLTLVRITKGCKGFEVIALNQNMVGSIGRIRNQSTFFDFGQHRQFIPKAFLHVFGFVLPNQTIFLVRPQKF